MPTIEAGSKVNSFGEFLGEHNSEWNLGRTVWFAQTLPLAEGSLLFRTAFLTCVRGDLSPWEFRIRLTDVSGKPLTVDLYSDTDKSKYDPDCRRNRPKYNRMDWPFPYFPAGQYALVLSRTGTVDASRSAIFGRSSPAPYPLGKAWRSTDSGMTWVELLDTTLNFSAFGYFAPPAPPPPPAIGNWYLVDETQTQLPDGYRIEVTTDVPVHLYLRWTTAPPGRHIKERESRGADVQKFIDQCFVAYHDLEQSETGDTLTHTFILTPWPVCETRWFYFWGTKALLLMPSASPIFEKHLPPYPLPITKCHSLPRSPRGNDQFIHCADEPIFKFVAPSAFTPTQFTFWHYTGPYWNPDHWVRIAVWTTLPDGNRGVKISPDHWHYVGALARWQYYQVDLPLTCPPLTAGVCYEIRAQAQSPGDGKPHFFYPELGQAPTCYPSGAYRTRWEWYYSDGADNPCLIIPFGHAVDGQYVFRGILDGIDF